jgi:hypothetical protein
LCQLQAEAESSALGFASGFDDLVDLLGAQPIRTPVFGFLPDDSENFGLRNRETHIVPDAEQYRSGGAPLLYDKRSALILDTTKKLAKIRPRIQGRDDNSIIHKLSISTN